MKTAKGMIRREDNTYLYTCGACNGSGFCNGGVCSHCYNLDYAKITKHLAGAKGQRYYSLLKAALSIAGKAIVNEFRALHAKHGKVTPVMLAYLALRFSLNYKATCEWLEETYCIPSGVTERIYSHYEFKVSRVYAAAEKWHKEQSGDDVIIAWCADETK